MSSLGLMRGPVEWRSSTTAPARFQAWAGADARRESQNGSHSPSPPSRADAPTIAVGTPPNEDGSSDLQYVLKVAATIGDHLNDSKVIVTSLTVPAWHGGYVAR